MTIHPAHSAHKLATNLATIQVLLTENPETQAAIVKAVKQAQDTLKQLREQMSDTERQREIDQQIFCDKLTFEFSTNADFSESYTRNYSGMVTDGETIKSIVYSERQLQNMSDEHLFARVTITDTDPEA
jgi:ATP-dependent helicase YprA (DUF1998 family)